MGKIEKIITIWGRYCQNGLFLEIFQRMGGAGGSCLIQKMIVKIFGIMNYKFLRFSTDDMMDVPQVHLPAGRRVHGWVQRRAAGWSWRVHWTTLLPGATLNLLSGLIQGEYKGGKRKTGEYRDISSATYTGATELTHSDPLLSANQCFFPQLDELSQLTKSCFYK